MKHIVIEDSEDLFWHIENGQLKPAASVLSVCQSILELNDKEKEIKISISKSMIPDSYHTVPAMFARTLEPRTQFNSVQAFLKGEYLDVYAGDKRKASTFRERARRCLSGKKKKFTMLRKNVPRTYRNRPSLLSSIMSSELGLRVCNSCKNNKITWKIHEEELTTA